MARAAFYDGALWGRRRERWDRLCRRSFDKWRPSEAQANDEAMRRYPLVASRPMTAGEEAVGTDAALATVFDSSYPEA